MPSVTQAIRDTALHHCVLLAAVFTVLLSE